MKKYLLIVSVIGCFGVSLAQTNTSWTVANNIVTPGETKTVVQDLGSDNMSDLQDIQSRFCNDNQVTKDLKLTMRPWQRKEICVIFSNPSTTPKDILFWFSEWILKDWAPICQADMTPKNTFSKQIKNNSVTGMTLPASWTIIQRFTYIAPKDTTWSVFWCFGYQMSKSESIKEGNMFLIVPRKVGYIYVNITWNAYHFGRRDDIKYTITDNKQTILKIIIAILAVRLVMTIVKTSKKKEAPKKK